MMGLDTNLLVRYLTQDDPRQAAIAAREIEAAAEQGETLLIQPLVLCELVGVLESAYKLPKADILAALGQILKTAQFEIADRDAVAHALADSRGGRGDFSDHYLGRANAAGGAPVTLIFDKALRDCPRFRVLTA